MVEIIAVIVIVGVLAVTATAAFNRISYNTVAAADRVRAIVSYAQKTATAARRAVKVSISGGALSLEICRVAGAGSLGVNELCPSDNYASLPLPSGGTSYAPSGSVVLSSSGTIYFDSVDGPPIRTARPSVWPRPRSPSPAKAPRPSPCIWRAAMHAINRTRGFTLVELMVMVVVLGIGLAGTMAAINQATLHSGTPFARKQATTIAEAIMEEITARDFTDDGTTPAVNIAGCGGGTTQSTARSR